MKLTISFMLFIHLLCSCSERKDDYLNKETLIELISKEDPQISSSLPLIYLFCKSNDSNKIGLINNDGLQKNFLGEKLKISYQDYVINIFNSTIKPDCQSLYECFDLNDTITSLYNKNQCNIFLTKYYKRDNENTYILNTDLSHNVKLTIFYYLFQNDYFTYFDDISGFYYSEKLRTPLIQENANQIYF